MRSLKEAIKLIVKDEKKIDWYLDRDEQISRKIAYNAALKDIGKFIIEYEEGNVNQEFLQALEEMLK